MLADYADLEKRQSSIAEKKEQLDSHTTIIQEGEQRRRELEAEMDDEIVHIKDRQTKLMNVPEELVGVADHRRRHMGVDRVGVPLKLRNPLLVGNVLRCGVIAGSDGLRLGRKQPRPRHKDFGACVRRPLFFLRLGAVLEGGEEAVMERSFEQTLLD